MNGVPPADRSRPRPGSREFPIVASLVGTALVFGALIFILPMVNGPAPEEEKGAALFRKAQALEEKDAPQALETYAKIEPDAGEWYDRAQDRIPRLQEEIATKAPEPTPEERKDHEKFLEFYRANPMDQDGLIRLGEAFIAAHPRGALRPEVERRMADARRGRDARRLDEAQEAERAADRHLEKLEFAAAIQELEKVSGRLRTDVLIWTRLSKKRDAIVQDARRFFRKRAEESEELVRLGKKEEARQTWYGTIRSLGDGKVPELADLSRAATILFEEIRP
ncbi:MAG TPA: hypothetical protein VK661_10580 [Planctomycetota bacterium]|jgi:hypothetical protein|nr:hypothetical protein [Planctomycetota bacterium]